MKENSEKKANISHALSILFLIWFFASIIMLVVSAKKGISWLMIMVFGQYFLVFGSAACVKLAQDRKLLQNSMIWIVSVIGLLALFYGLDAMDGNVERVRFLYVCSACLIGCGIMAAAGPFMDVLLRKRRCTQIISAEVVDIKSTVITRHTNAGTKRKTLYCPVYEIYYGGRNWQLCDMVFDGGRYTNGQSQELMLNPDAPQDFYDSSRMKGYHIISFIFALCYMTVGIGLLFLKNR